MGRERRVEKEGKQNAPLAVLQRPRPVANCLKDVDLAVRPAIAAEGAVVGRDVGEGVDVMRWTAGRAGGRTGGAGEESVDVRVASAERASKRPTKKVGGEGTHVSGL